MFGENFEDLSNPLKELVIYINFLSLLIIIIIINIDNYIYIFKRLLEN